MPRPQRCRRICRLPENSAFSPDVAKSDDKVVLTFDEYEVIRLVDFEKLTHEQCSMQMDISRTTVTEIYENARYKIADSIVSGKRMVIEGGNYRMCDGNPQHCIFNSCHKEDKKQEFEKINLNRKGNNIMRIAVTYENGMIFQHFGHTAQFKLYEVEDNKIVSEKVVETLGSGHGALAGFLSACEADVLICGGIGGGAQNALAQAGIKLYGGVSGNADDAVADFIAGKLLFNPNVKCSHHDHEHGEGHTCGDHGCGNHSCH